MKIKDFKQKTQEELQKSLRENREKLRQLRFDLALSKVKNFREFGKIKKNIARILTVLSEKGKDAK